MCENISDRERCQVGKANSFLVWEFAVWNRKSSLASDFADFCRQDTDSA